MERKKVLIVDDSIIIRDMLQKLVERCGCTVSGVAKDGKEGIEMFKTLEPDVVFMDINMPIVDGMEAARSILSINPSAKIIMLSAMGDDTMIATLKEIGVTVVLKKPIDNHDIISALASLA